MLGLLVSFKIFFDMFVLALFVCRLHVLISSNCKTVAHRFLCIHKSTLPSFVCFTTVYSSFV